MINIKLKDVQVPPNPISILLVLALVSLVGLSQGVGFYLDTAELSYRPEDTILVTAVLENSLDIGIDILIESTLSSQNDSISERQISSTLTLRPGELRTIELYRIIVTEDFPEDRYMVEARLISDGVVEDQQQTEFLVEGTLKEMVFGVHLCRDEDCQYESTIFVKGENIYLAYDSPIQGLEVEGTLSYSDGSKENITIPSIIPSVLEGQHTLRVTASKSGYKSKTITMSFAAIGEEPQIPGRNLSRGAEFNLTDLQITPAQVEVNQTVNVSARVTNTGSAEGSLSLHLKKNGQVDSIRDLTLEPGKTTIVSFNCTGESPGETRVELDGLSAVFTVMGEPAGTIEPAEIIKVLRDLEYGRYTLNDVQHPLYLDLYLPQPEVVPPPPLIIYLHGGGWVEGSKDNGRSLATALAEEGYAVACVDYRLAACCEGDGREVLRFPAQIQDIKSAVRWLRVHAHMYGFDPERFGALGDSSGGHLAALLGTSHGSSDLEGDQNPGPSDEVQAICDWYGPVDVSRAPPEILFEEDPCQVGLEYLITRYGGEERPFFYWTLVWAMFLGGSLTDPAVVARARQASPLTHIDAADPPILVIHGEDDNMIPIDQSEMLVVALEGAGVNVTFVRLPGIGHSFASPIGTDLEVDPAFLEPSIRFFDRHLKQD